MYPVSAVIHLSHFRENIRFIRRHVGPKVKICAAIKADAYGHGSIEIAKTAVEEGAELLAVARTDEGVALRKNGIRAPVLILGLPLPDEIPLLYSYGLDSVVADAETVRCVEKEAEKCTDGRFGHTTNTWAENHIPELHLKVDTGMGRIGCSAEEALHLARMIAGSSRLRLGGVCTHFPLADDSDQSFTYRQIDIFGKIISEMQNEGIRPGIVHAANSGAVLHCPESHFDMVRPGILLYGYYPSRDQERILPVKPVMEVESRVVFLKKVPAGTPVSYGLTYKTTKETVIATLPVGYGDGYNRLLSNKGHVFINGKCYPVAGRVCMDQTMVDVGRTSGVKLYDKAVLFGPDPAGPSAEDIAEITGTIPYEVVTGINKRVPRVYRDEV